MTHEIAVLDPCWRPSFTALQALLVPPFDFLCSKNFCYFGPVFQYEKHEPPESSLAFGQYSDWRPLRRTSGCHFFRKICSET